MLAMELLLELSWLNEIHIFGQAIRNLFFWQSKIQAIMYLWRNFPRLNSKRRGWANFITAIVFLLCQAVDGLAQ